MLFRRRFRSCDKHKQQVTNIEQVVRLVVVRTQALGAVSTNRTWVFRLLFVVTILGDIISRGITKHHTCWV